jgi:RNA polymerase sigma-70 factor (ECF subfamily)
VLPREEEFKSELEPHRRAITLHCYRMLGSLHDAEEVAQESLLRAWQRLEERLSSAATRAWLYKIATNACLDVLKTRRRRRALPHLLAPPATPGIAFGPPLPETVWVEPAPDSLLDPPDGQPGPDRRAFLRESIGLAFITALQLLSPKQRAVLLLVDVLGWRPQETAELLETTVASVNSLLQRARRSVESRPDQEGPAAAAADDDLLRRYIATWESGDLDAFAALLAEDARLSMPPQPEWYAGREAVRAFLAHILATQRHHYRLLPVAANGQRAVAVYTAPTTGGDFRGEAINVLAIRGGRVSEMTRFAAPHLFPLFGLPERLPVDRA